MNNKLTPILLPTEDASHLVMRDIRPKLYPHTEILKSRKDSGYTNQHLYLCSSEEIKIGDVVVEKLTTGKEMIITIHTLNDIDTKTQRKIILTTDPKLIADGILPIDGNTEAWINIYNPGSGKLIGQDRVNFHTEFCKRYNQKDNQKVDVEKLTVKIKDNVAKNCKDFNRTFKNWEELSEFVIYIGRTDLLDIYINEVVNQALQGTRGYSLEDVKKIHELSRYTTNSLDSIIQSLTPQPKGEQPIYDELSKVHDWICEKMERISQEQINKDGIYLGMYRAYKNVVNEIEKISPPFEPKGDMVIEVEMEEVKHQVSLNSAKHPTSHLEIKLTNGQPTLIFK